jgi:hypothetical protein
MIVVNSHSGYTRLRCIFVSGWGLTSSQLYSTLWRYTRYEVGNRDELYQTADRCIWIFLGLEIFIMTMVISSWHTTADLVRAAGTWRAVGGRHSAGSTDSWSVVARRHSYTASTASTAGTWSAVAGRHSYTAGTAENPSRCNLKQRRKVHVYRVRLIISTVRCFLLPSSHRTINMRVNGFTKYFQPPC